MRELDVAVSHPAGEFPRRRVVNHPLTDSGVSGFNADWASPSGAEATTLGPIDRDSTHDEPDCISRKEIREQPSIGGFRHGGIETGTKQFGQLSVLKTWGAMVSNQRSA
jgi:hypothetical protein